MCFATINKIWKDLTDTTSISHLTKPFIGHNSQLTGFLSGALSTLSWGSPLLRLDEIKQIEEEEIELYEGLSSQQIFLWLQGLFLFSLVWTIAGTINADSRKKFDLFFRNLIMGMDDNNPRPRSVRITKNNIFPDKGNLSVVMFLCSSWNCELQLQPNYKL